MIPKGAKYGNKVFTPNVGVDRVRELLDDTDPKTTFLPETISIIDLDTEIVNVLNEGNLSVVSDSRKQKVPAYIFGAEKWSEFAKTWQYIKVEFFQVKDRRSFVGGLLSSKSPDIYLVPLRVWLGIYWALQGSVKVLHKLDGGWRSICR